MKLGVGLGMCPCGANWFGLMICHCAECHLTFGGITGFDDHRRSGCLSKEEMFARGYIQDDAGFIRKPTPPPGTFKNNKKRGC